MSRGATARLFVAVDPPPGVCQALAAWGREAAAGLLASGRGSAEGLTVRLLGASAMHLTLCFLGSRPTTEIAAIASALDACRAPPGELTLGAPLLLPPRRARSLAVEVHDRSGALSRVQQELASTLAATIDWEPERRRFRAHVTVARIGRNRVRSGERGRSSRGLATPDAPAELPPTPPARFTPRAVVLYRSSLAPTGATYEALHTRGLYPSDS